MMCRRAVLGTFWSPSLGRRQKLNHEETPVVSETGAGLDGAQGVLRRLARCTALGARRHGRVVGERHPCARDHLGGGDLEVFAVDPHRRQTTAIYPVRRHRCLQCTDGGTEKGQSALRSPEATGGHARRLIDYLHSVPEEHFTRETPFRHRLRLDTYSHYPLHARAIREWRERPVQ